jgi:hypothetical protein
MASKVSVDTSAALTLPELVASSPISRAARCEGVGAASLVKSPGRLRSDRKIPVGT